MTTPTTDELRDLREIAEKYAKPFIGRVDKPFHRPECICVECEAWCKEHPVMMEINPAVVLRLIDALLAERGEGGKPFDESHYSWPNPLVIWSRCRKCGRFDCEQPRSKYCGDGGDKDNPHSWEPFRVEGKKCELIKVVNYGGWLIWPEGVGDGSIQHLGREGKWVNREPSDDEILSSRSEAFAFIRASALQEQPHAR